MTEIIHLDRAQSWPDGVALPSARVPGLVRTAARAPSVHNTQPWRFGVDGNAVELRADRSRALAALDPAGRDMTISCGAALFGLRLAIRRLGYVPAVSALPDPRQPDLLARVYLGPRKPATARERRLLAALPRRHTHRGSFSPEPLPGGLLVALQHDAVAEGAELVLVDRPGEFGRLAAAQAAAQRRQDRDPAITEEIRRWTRPPGSAGRDGVPARAYSPLAGGGAGTVPGFLPRRDFDLGRGEGMASGAGRGRGGGVPPAATAILVTAADTPGDWLRAGQALHRVLADAAAGWVFASLSSQAAEFGQAREMLRLGLSLTAAPQLVLQFGRCHITEATPRRPVRDVLG